jgi:hypothetical protein
MTRPSVLEPHEPGQGSMHFWFTQALLDGQSLLTAHSGRQFGAVPIIPAWHAHFAWPETTWQTELGPEKYEIMYCNDPYQQLFLVLTTRWWYARLSYRWLDWSNDRCKKCKSIKLILSKYVKRKSKYLVKGDIEWTGLQCFLLDNCRWDCDLWHGIRHPFRKYLDKDLGTFDWCRPVIAYTRHSTEN